MSRKQTRKIIAGAVATLALISMRTVSAQDNAYPFISIDKGDAMSIRNDRGDNTSGDWSYTRNQLTSYGPVPEFNREGLKPPAIEATDRIGWSSDGTNDEDDWAAVAVVWATLAKAGLQDQFVHFDYNDRLSDHNKPEEAEGMRDSSIEGALQFRFNDTKVFDGLDAVQLEACVQHLVEQINMSSEDSKFYYIQAGTFEVAYRALERAEPNKRKYCVLVSHSEMNEWEHKWKITDMTVGDITNSVGAWARGMVDCVNPVSPSGDPDIPTGLGASFYFTSKMGVELRPPRPQFGSRNYRGGWPLVEWMKTSHPAYRWVHERFRVAMAAKGDTDDPENNMGLDASDGGMCFAMVTGEYDFGEAGGFAALDTFLERSLTLPASRIPEVTRLELINMNNNDVVRLISDGDVIDPAGLPNNVTIRAVTDPVTIDSVTFNMDGDSVIDELGSLYTINENSYGWISKWDYTEKTYNLKVTPELNGAVGDSYSVRFTIGEGTGETKPPVITSPAAASPAAISVNESTQLSVMAEPSEGGTLSYSWSLTNGPAEVTFANSNAETTNVDGFTAAGKYDFGVTVWEGTEQVTGLVTIIVNGVGDETVVGDLTVSIESPIDGQPISASTAIKVTVSADDDSGIRSVYLRVNNVWLTDGDNEFPYEFNLGTLSPDKYEILARAVANEPVGAGEAGSDTINIEVVADPEGNVAPVATPQNTVTSVNTARTITLAGSDQDDDPLTFKVVKDPDHGTLDGTAPDLTYTPNPGYTGTDSFRFTTNDTRSDSAEAVVSIVVEDVATQEPGLRNEDDGGCGGCSGADGSSAIAWLLVLLIPLVGLVRRRLNVS